MPEHVDITDPEIHEPKGVSTATLGSGYFSDGAGSGNWTTVGTTQIDTSEIFNINKFSLMIEIPDVSTADTVLVPLPFACTLTKATSILHTAITGANSILTFINSTGPTSIGTITVTQSGSAEGDIDTLTPVANNAFTAGTYLKVTTDGASSTASRVTVHLEFLRTA